MADRPVQWWVAAGLVILGLAGLAQWAVPGAAPLAYDPEAWLVWARELARGELDVTAGPAIKPLPMLLGAATTTLAGADAARALWAALALAGLIAAVMLAWRAAREAGRSAAWAVAAAAAVLATPTMLAGGLTGAAEPLALAGLLAAARLLGRARWAAAMLVLGLTGLLRPEALAVLLLGAAGSMAAEDAPGARGRRVAAAVAVCIAVTAVWAGLQQLGAGDLGGGVEAATALRDGQPGTAQHPALATARAAASMLWPALLVLGAATLLTRPRSLAGQPAPTACRSEHWWLIALGAGWIAAVVAMSELGFSGEPRYLAPGTAAVSIGVLLAAADRVGQGAEPRRLVPGVAAASLVAAAAVVAAAAWADARQLARSQHDLDALLGGGPVQASVRTCQRVGVPRFMRPPTAWRLDRALAEIRSPGLRGADCRLARGTQPPLPAPWRRVDDSRTWAWWQHPRPRLNDQTDP